ncbi:hypothetical protein [Noviherbaspirillum denitrificans]|uniref:Outer membrane lipoprotein-sorting protein n=1 Tax=Noviherbaspirillum denitrificans TaxID=1968433 RepID=A0A254THF4_9BURK|nr:hypothetical protein [Noviherbaspirillum denitrificans]OWW21607.1 hypothetical protein AYR66_21070 [Noviherbaspirillum denitrificans]
MKFSVHTIVPLAALLTASAFAAEPPQALLAKIASAYGATPPAALVEEGKTTSFRRGEGKLLRQYKAPDRFSIRIDYSTGSEARILLGDKAWQQGAPANPMLRGAIMLQVARIALPWNMLAKRSTLVDLGPVSSDGGKPGHAIEFPLEEQLRLVVEVDPESGRILRSRGIYRMGEGTMEFATVYADYRTVDGRLHAAREEHYAMGQHTGFSVIEKVSYPFSLSDSAFAP